MGGRRGAAGAIVANEAEPFACVRCGKPFGVRPTIDRMVEKLAGHSTFADDPREREMHEGAQAEREAEQGAEAAKRSDQDDGGNA